MILKFLSVLILIFAGMSLTAQEADLSMRNAEAFIEYVSGPLGVQEAYTIDLLIDKIRYKFDDNSSQTDDQRDALRNEADYFPELDRDLLDAAVPHLMELEFINFQPLGTPIPPIVNLKPLQYLPKLKTLVLTDNEVADLTPLQQCPQLKRLGIRGNPVSDFKVIELISTLKELEIGTGQISAFCELKEIPKLQCLKIDSENFESFQSFPEMPQLRELWGGDVISLDGLERFVSLENIQNLSGPIESLNPLSRLKKLTHLHLIDTNVQSVSPLVGLQELRVLWLGTNAENIDLSPLYELRNLHEVSLGRGNEDFEGVKQLRLSLALWDDEFKAESPRFEPSLRVEVVDQATFDYYDTEAAYNISDNETNTRLVASELEWLDKQLDQVFAGTYKDGDDFSIPYKWMHSRSRPIVLYSERAVNEFPVLATKIQRILSHARNDWIIYIQSDGVSPDFIAWIYPDKLVVTEENAKRVQQLVGASKTK